MRRLTIAVVGLAVSLVVAASGSAAGSYTCLAMSQGTAIPAGTYESLIVTGTNVPYGAYCYVAPGTTVTVNGPVTVTRGSDLDTRDGTLRVEGNVFVDERAMLYVIGGDRIEGNITDHGGFDVTIGDSEVIGDLVGTGLFQQLSVYSDEIHGSISLTRMTATNPAIRFQIFIANNVIRGNVTLTANNALAFLGSNRIIGTVSCTANVPPPDLHSSPNTIIGTASGQCAAQT